MMSSEIVQELDPELAAEDGDAVPGAGPAGSGEPPGGGWRQELAEELVGRPGPKGCS
jgi:hypothetical protein